ncbi:MAG: ACP S-malonyltransferase [Alphaproteobacteria bacterium]|nr:MAG: ACP S-malonyltransferase [Alphaproteobacteria bacterium]
MRKYSILFPGQGSQKSGLYSEICNNKLFDDAKEIYPNLMEIMGKSDAELSQTVYAQPLLYVFSSIMFVEFMDRFKQFKPEYVAGHSVGEYAACFAAGCFDFITGLKLVKIRSELMSECPGTMFACIANIDDVIKFVDYVSEETGLICEIANYNHESQIVISCDTKLEEFIKDHYKRFIPRCIQLKVSGGFHSSLVASANDKLKPYLSEVKFNDPIFPVISNKTGLPSMTGDEVKSNLLDHIISQVKWKNTIEYMINHGVSYVIEMSPSNILSKLAEKYSMSGVTINSIGDIMNSEILGGS